MASRELNILITAKNLAGPVLSGVKGQIGGIQSEARRGAQNVVRNVGIASVAAAGLVATQVRAGMASLAELERVNTQTAAVLASTMSSAGGNAQAIRARSEELEQLTSIDDKAIQNAQNLLLTFRQIPEKAFIPTLEAALDLNTALGGDEDSLQGVMIQVAKAVNDPLKGLTMLRRAGVSFTQQQMDTIKALVKSNDLYGAQQIILGELNDQFGGSAAAQADTYAGKMRLVADAVEDAQMALATAFLPVLLKVGDKLQDFLSKPETLQGIKELGETLAGGLDDAIEIAGKLPWDAIGTTFSLMGAGAKVVLDMFTKLPPWVQTAVLTGWGLNKLTGGALGNIVGALGSGLIKGVLGMNAGVVNINAGVVNGGGPGGGGGPGIAGTIAQAAGVVAAGAAAQRGGEWVMGQVAPPGQEIEDFLHGELSPLEQILSSGRTEAQATRTLANDIGALKAAQRQNAREQVAEARFTTQAIRGLKMSPTFNLTASISTSVSIDSVNRASHTTRVAVGNRGGIPIGPD